MYGRDGSPVGVIITESGSRRGSVHEGRLTGIMAYPMSPRALLPHVSSYSLWKPVYVCGQREKTVASSSSHRLPVALESLEGVPYQICTEL